MNRKLGNLYGTARLGLCLAGVLGFVNSSYGSEEEAVQPQKFELNIVESTTGADEILAGNMTGGVGKIHSTLSVDSRYARATNLCTAYTAQGEFASAKEHCKAALHLSRSANHALTATGYITVRSRQAMALNNLGVWYALQGNKEEAREHFETAGKKGKRLLATSKRNLHALEQRADSNVASAS